MCRGRLVVLLLPPLLALCTGAARAQTPIPIVSANDNRTHAGQLSANTFAVQLEIRDTRWYPDDEGGESVVVQAFGEVGRPAQVPGPLLRVPEGTTLDVTITNRLASAARVFGLHTRPGVAGEAIEVPAGAIAHVRFAAGAPGTYYYWGTTAGKALDERNPEETQLSGAFVVDPAGAAPDDRVFVIGIWVRCTPDREHCIEVPAINGKSWPFSERFTFTAGEPVRWRWVNTSLSAHAMHLHGFYFGVEGAGDGERESYVPPGAQRQVVTERVPIGGTFRMRWTPEAAGNWLFHCHMTVHMERHPRMDADPRTAYTGHIEGFPNDAGMGGLVLGVTVHARPAATPAAASGQPRPRRLRLLVRVRPATARGLQGFSYDLAGETDTPPVDLPPIGRPLVLTRGEPVEITVTNQLAQPTAVHWHGIELESYYDGVPGWTGHGSSLTPPIAPDTSFVVRFTPPRAGTFIYHTHWHDVEQLTGGLVGALVVLEPGTTFDPERDKSFVVSRSGSDELAAGSFLINGSPQPAPLRLSAGTAYRLRLVNITTNNVNLRAALLDRGMPVRWRPVAKDGMPLPPDLAVEGLASQIVSVGETYDFEFTPRTPGILFFQGALPGLGFVATQVFIVER
jgi:FtsP/CotA-like multicopper oxidase with cupredoxin domain